MKTKDHIEQLRKWTENFVAEVQEIADDFAELENQNVAQGKLCDIREVMWKRAKGEVEELRIALSEARSIMKQYGNISAWSRLIACGDNPYWDQWEGEGNGYDLASSWLRKYKENTGEIDEKS